MKTYLLLIFCFTGIVSLAQLRKDIDQIIKSDGYSTRGKLIEQCYLLNGNQLIWQKGYEPLRQLFSQWDEYALDENYNIKLSGSAQDSVNTDVMITDKALQFFIALKTGEEKPGFKYDGLNYKPAISNIPGLLLKHLSNNNLDVLVEEIQPPATEYKNALRKWQLMNERMKNADQDGKITSNILSSGNTNLLKRLYQTGIIDSLYGSMSISQLTSKIKEAQILFDLPVTGILDKQTINELNVPIQKRLLVLKRAISYLRWSDDFKKQSNVLLLNLPSANFYVYNNSHILLESKIIAGKQSTPTPTLTSTITETILYPYWMVPDKIARNELLPAIKKDPGFIDKYNYQVLNRQGKIMNPYSISWKSFNSSYFPYIIRQSTGCDNALGIVKFNFYNPFTVYLHDTPIKPLFSFRKRFFSHGCMRVEKPEDLAHILLGTNRIAIDTLTEKGCIRHQSPLTVPVQVKMPVVVLYSPVWYTSKGAIIFYDDIYNRLN